MKATTTTTTMFKNKNKKNAKRGWQPQREQLNVIAGQGQQDRGRGVAGDTPWP